MKKIIALIMTISVLAALLAGCGNTNSEPTPAPDAQPNNEITVGIPQDLDDSIDPHQMSTAGTREVLFNVFEGLVKPTSDGNLEPAVAAGYEISPDGTTFTFTLREGVKFHNGATVTADDVVYSLSRCAGFPDSEPMIAAFAVVESVEKTDEKTVVLKTLEPNIEFLSYLTAAIIPAGYEEQATKPIGTGPFYFVSRSPQENFVIEKFDGYWGETAHMDKVTYKIIENAETLLMSLKSGAVDLVAHLLPSQVTDLGDEYTVLEDTMKLVQAVYLNHTREPFDNEKVRQALSYAIDRVQIMDMIADGHGAALGSSMYPAFSKYFTPELVGYYGYDPEKATALLAEAGYPDGFEMEITVPSNYKPHVDTAEVVVQQLSAIGVTATINLVEWSTWKSDAYDNRNFQATIVGFDASGAMTARALLERFGSGSSKNFIGFNDSEYDEVLQAAIASTDDAEQTELYKRLQTILTERAANLYIQDLCDLVAMRSDIKGYEFYPIYVMDMSKLYCG